MSEPAFPLCAYVNHYAEGQTTIYEGMTLRDYFAAKAMPALITASVTEPGAIASADNISVNAYAIADAMLKARSE